MLIYIITFIIVEILAILSTRKKNYKNDFKLFLVILIVIIISLVGGLRNTKIGTDVSVYGERWFKLATSCDSFISYKNLLSTSDIGYVFLNYIVSRFTSNFNAFLFIHQLICNGIIVAILYKNKDKCNFSIALLAYLCLFYCRTFNFLRQAVALSLIFYAIICLIDNNVKKFITMVFVSTLFHFTAIFCLLLYPIKKICSSESKRKKIYIFFIIVILLLVTINIENVISFLYFKGIVNDRIYNYLITFANKDGKILNFEFLIKAGLLCLIFFNSKKLINNNDNNYFLITLVIIEFIFFQLRNKILYADRISLYYGYSIMLILPQISKCFSQPKKQLLFEIFISTILVMFWYYKFVYCGSCEIYPYKFYWN